MATTPEILAIGASAGGPSALSTLLGGLPADMPMPVVIVQHMPEEFVSGLARWLTKVTPMPVEIAVHNRLLKPGMAYLAPGNAHLAVSRQGQFLAANLIDEAGGYRYRPAVDVLFESVATACGAAAIGIIMTGMGDDGAAGMLAMRQSGAHTFAQDKTSCTVFGMPAAAIERGGIEQVMALERLPDAVRRLAG
jgi:two-component system chemotaxis response regulator CheB